MSSMLNWFDKTGDDLSQGVGDIAGSVGDIVKDVWSNVSESVSSAFEGGTVPDFISGLVAPSSDGGASYSANYAARQGVGYTAPEPAESKSWGDMFKGFVSSDKNQSKLLEMGFGAVLGMAKDSAAKDAAKYKAEADMAILNQKDKLEQEANQRFSQSIGGLKPVQQWKPKPLTRVDGSRVFTPTGLINTGAK